MPDMDGFAAIEYLRAHPEISTTPIMMLTTEAQSSDAARCRELGHSAYLLKPYSQSDLFDAIVTALGLPGIHKTSRDTSNGSRKNQRELNVLLAEDNHVNQTLATRLLQKFGHRVEVARNGRIAVDKWQTGYYDLILMDVDMPELNGLDATAKIRELEQQSSGHIPIIGLTAHAMRGSREKCLAAGMDGYLSKPIDTNALWRELESVGTALPPPAPATPEDKPGSAAISCDFDLNNALSLMDNDMELFREMARIFLADYTDYLEKLGIAIMQKDPKNSRHFAHALKGMISIFGVPEISRIAGAIEMQESDNLDHDYAELKGKLDRLSQALQKAAS
jgi:CheY-like chemotaxis protein